jgi:hypothetical protein
MTANPVTEFLQHLRRVEQEVRDCVIRECALFPFRPFQDIGQRNPNDPPPPKPAPDTPTEAQTGDLPTAGPDIA